MQCGLTFVSLVVVSALGLRRVLDDRPARTVTRDKGRDYTVELERIGL
jgi:hypothetical protein